MLTISSGHGADYLLDAVAQGRENYYTGAVTAGEPPGRWYGRGAEALGLSGLVDHQDMTALYEHFLDPRDEAFTDPEQWSEASTLGHTGRKYLSEDELYAAALEAEPDASAERRAELRLDAGKRARRNVAFLDATFSVQKSVTVLHTAFEAQEVQARTAGDEHAAEAWAQHRQAVEDAIWAGNNATLEYLAEHAGYSRVGHHGGAAGRYVDAHDWTVASFFQHDNRDHDPQLHIHNAILNRVQGADGTWRTLDSRAIHKFRGAAAAVGERTMEEHLSRALGVQFATRPDGKAREVLGVPSEVMDLFSSRRRAITSRTRELVEAFETKFDRSPNSLELDRLQRQATFATRQSKSHDGESVEARLERWDRELRSEVAGGLEKVAGDVLKLAGEQPHPQAFSPRAVIETALADVQSRKAAWTEPDLTRAISDALPDHLATNNGDQVTTVLNTLTEQALALAVPLDTERPGDAALPDELRVANGRSAYDAPAGRLYATPEHVHTERVLTAATAHADAAALPSAQAQQFVAELGEAGIELGADQAAAVRGALTSGARIESLVGPAGTGKSFVVGTLAKAWQDPDLWDGQSRRVVGLATSQIATEVLAGEGLDARNVARWLATQDRLADGRAAADDEVWRLAAGDLVVVDESAMSDTADLAAIHSHAEAAGAKLLLVGDHKQLAAVGAGGGMEMLAEAGASYELAEARRFHHTWERDASLRLRAGDESVLHDYHQHGRLIDAGAVEQAEASATRAWLGDTLAGRRSVLLVDTNEQAARLSAELRAELVRLGQVNEHGVPLTAQGTYAGVGDVIQARRNGWELAGYAGNRRGPINREHYRVLAAGDDGHLVVAPIHGRTTDGEQLGERMTLPADYVAAHVALGYASTVHAAQGLTVDASHTVITPTTGADALYVGLSRGREANTAHVTTRAVPEDAAPGAVNTEAVHKSPTAVLAATLDGAETDHSALATATESAQDMESVRTPAELLADASELATAGRTARWLDELADTGALTSDERARLAAEDGSATLSRILRRAELAGHDPRAVLADAVGDRSLSGARQLSNVLYHRIASRNTLDPRDDSYADRVPTVDEPDWRAYLDSLAAAADQRQRTLGEQVAENPPQWAIEALGPVPDDPSEAGDWVTRAGAVAAHRELTGHDDPAEPIGTPPRAGQVEAYASWRCAWRALGRPESQRDELEMSDGQLRMRVRAAQREAAWAPRYVGNELAGTIQAADQHRHTASLRSTEAEATSDPERQAQLRQQADEAAALAEALDARTAHLREAEQARGRWLAHTAATRAASDRATAELSARGADADPATDDHVTAEEWLAAHEAANAIEDPHRHVTGEHELAEVQREREADHHAAIAPGPEPEQTAAADRAAEAEPESPRDREAVSVEDADADRTGGRDTVDSPGDLDAGTAQEAEAATDDVAEQQPESARPDLREVAVEEPAPAEDDTVRVPSADDTADSVQRAQRALAEIAQREAAERQREADEARAAQLAQWHAQDQAAEQAAAVEHDTMQLDPVGGW
ncbi:conjugative relaxase domain-containing protein, TrwC/TraI family [Haloechinothrix alba]|uniref:Conjugative relaxase domain-containing protein, TrwC/TraI family n=1 Tax=Haloechinothrix alba TaxID=664784 RepID=A0A238V4J3_9PSEU|nr:MobF family relaxase [Haloechinothrix alba]SNR29156.1 conjugative relaxase domain-containing protein, TrwC/TraI family [Haloechinothrix alba]